MELDEFIVLMEIEKRLHCHDFIHLLQCYQVRHFSLKNDPVHVLSET